VVEDVLNRPLIERLRATAEVGAAFAPVHAVFGVHVVEVQKGRTVFAQDVDHRVLDADGRLCPGALLVGIDGVLGLAIGSTLPVDRSITTLSLHSEFVRVVPPERGTLVLRGRAEHIDEETATAVGEILDDDGRLYAHLSTRCAVLHQASTVTHEPIPPRDADGDPWTSAHGLAPAAERLTRARVSATSSTGATVTAVASDAIGNMRGHLQGGALGMLAQQAVSAAVRQCAPHLATATAVGLDVQFIRPALVDGGVLTADAQVVHVGRRFAVVHATVRDAAGRTLVLATGSLYASEG
jgi:acyl-CoA thioesterase